MSDKAVKLCFKNKEKGDTYLESKKMHTHFLDIAETYEILT